MLKAGGSAAEAAVAMAAALAVVYPHMNSIGGDSFWLVREPSGRVFGIDASGRAAGRADVTFYRSRGLDVIPWRGPLAANTVAGTLSGWSGVLCATGSTAPLTRLLEPAIAVADEGAPVTASFTELICAKRGELEAVPGFAETFLGGGAVLKQPALARTLRRLAASGLDDAYRGSLSEDIAADLALAGSPVTLADLQAHRAEQVQPLSVNTSWGKLYNMPPPTQGLASLMILALYDRLAVKDGDFFAHIHGLVEATKLAFRVRDQHVGDPARMTIPAQAFLDDGPTLDRMAASINPKRARPWPWPASPGDTVWFGAMDSRGWAVSAIQSIYFEFGSGVVLPQTGITWQNRGASFSLAEEGPNVLRPGCKPFHTLNPAMAELDDGRVIAYGTMGGEGQPQTQAAVFSRYAVHGVDLQEAITAPRWLLGRTWGETSTNLKLEDRFDPALVQALGRAGHELELVAPFTSMMGHAGALVRLASGSFQAATDPRSDGAALAF
jgi:gamma-glutamyltranspeptidase/glutathione hydrolase